MKCFSNIKQYSIMNLDTCEDITIQRLHMFKEVRKAYF